ncbi:MAG: efflux RND transporter periplasmic adaptor subunit [Snowella sp.]|nr:MAG: efflux RND transporter periplasmic adaptor subunit [Snowella sp.]
MADPQLSGTPLVSEKEIIEEKPNTLPTEPLPKLKAIPNNLWQGIFGLVVLVALGGFGLNWWIGQQKDQQAPKQAMAAGPQAIPVKLQTATLSTIENASELVGTLEASRAAEISSEIDGRISEILVKEGDLLTQGQVIMRLDTDTLQTELLQARAALARDQAALAELEAGSRSEDIAEAQATLRQAQSQLANVQGGASPEEIAQAQAQLNSAKAEADLTKQRVQRYSSLKDEGVIALDAYEQRLKEQKQAIADVQAAQRRLSQLRKGRGSDMDRIQAEVEEKRQNLNRLKNGARPENIAQAKAQVAESQAKVRTVEVQIQKSQIKSPFTGIVGYIPTKVGNYVKAGDPLTTITENKALEINLSVPLDQAPQLRLGLPVQILDSQGKAIARGNISFISPNVTTNAQSVLVRASFNNIGRELLNRQLVPAKIIWNEGSGILIPATAISRIGSETFVFVAESAPDPKTKKSQLVAKKQAITLGNMQGNNYQVRSGLNAGEKFVTAGSMNLQEGMPVMDVNQMPTQMPGSKP